jgi:hypothetical protein
MIGRTLTALTGSLVVAITVAAAPAAASARQTSLGSVRLPRAVTANGAPLPAGTYTIRLSDDAVTPVVGQPAGSERWVEFVQGGQVKGKELATVVSSGDVKAVAKTPPPGAGANKVQLLRGADYLRVWLNQGGTQYLVHLSVK